MKTIIHPRPNPIVAAMYTLRDLDADVIILHGPSGCGFMAARMLEEAGVRVLSTGMKESDLIFGASDKLQTVIKEAERMFDPELIGVVGTCSSMIIGEDMQSAIDESGSLTKVIAVDVHGCMEYNTLGAVKALEAAYKAGLIPESELSRQKTALEAASTMEVENGMASKEYLMPVRGPTKLSVAEMIHDTLSNGGRITAIMNAKKELAYRFADINLALHQASEVQGGEVRHIGNIDPGIGLPRIRRYAESIGEELSSAGVDMEISGGLDEYAFTGLKAMEMASDDDRDLLIISGIPHSCPGIHENDILITDQPRQLSNYLARGFRNAVGEISSHSMVMSANRIVPSETGDTLRQLTGLC